MARVASFIGDDVVLVIESFCPIYEVEMDLQALPWIATFSAHQVQRPYVE